MIVVGCSLVYIFSSKKTLPPIVYRIAIDETWHPLQLYDKKQDITLFSNEILQIIAEKQHFSLKLIQVGSDNLFMGLDNGKYEGILSFLTLEDNAEKYISSNPYYLLGPVLVVSKSSPIKSVKDLNGKIIGVITGQQRIDSIYKNNKIELVFYDYNNRFDMIDDTMNNVIDGMFVSELTAYEYTRGIYQEQLEIVSVPLTNVGLRLIAKNNPESKKLIAQFNEGLKLIKTNGIYSHLLSKWELHNPEKD